jgi:MATE family multidrug resistance protein
MKYTIEQIKPLALLSAPLLIAKLGVPIRGLAVTWIFAQLGTQALMAGALGYSLLMVMVTFFLGVLMSSLGVLIAYATGADDTQQTTRVLQHGLWLGILLSIPVMLLLYNVAPVLRLLGQEEAIVTLVSQFAHGLAWIFIPYTVVVSAAKLFTNLKKTHIPMLYSFWGLFATVITSYALALGKWGFPEMGIAGVGWGMAIAYWSQALIIGIHISFGKYTQAYPIFRQLIWPKLNELNKLWRIGWPVGLKYSAEFGLFFIIAAIIGVVHYPELAVYQVILQLFMISSCLSSGVGLGTEALVGQALGGLKNSVVKPTCYAGMLLTTVYIGTIVIALWLFPHWFAHFFFPDDSVDFILFLHVIGWVIAFQLLDGMRKVTADILITFKDPQFPLVAEVIGSWGIGLPLGYVIGVMAGQGLVGFLLSLVIGLLVSFLLMFTRFRKRLVTIMAYPS